MMSQRSKKELTESIRGRYLRANKAKKQQILDEFVAATGYHPEIRDTATQAWDRPSCDEEKGTTKEIRQRSCRCIDPDLGDLWKDMLQTAETILARNHTGIGKTQGNTAEAWGESIIVGNELRHYRPPIAKRTI